MHPESQTLEDPIGKHLKAPKPFRSLELQDFGVAKAERKGPWKTDSLTLLARGKTFHTGEVTFLLACASAVGREVKGRENFNPIRW